MENPEFESQEKDATILELRKQVEELLAEVDRLKNEEKPKPVDSIASYKPGEYVFALTPVDVNYIRAKVIEFLPNKSGVIVSTARGEFTIADATRIRKGES